MVFRRLLCFLLVLSVAFTLCGCSKKFSLKTVDEMKKQLKNLKAYQCDVRMSVTNNRSTIDYVMKHYYKREGKYRIEIVSPEELKGQLTIYNGNKAYVFHPGVNQYLVTENFSKSMEHDVFAGSFLERFENDADAHFLKEKVGERQYFIMEFNIENGNIYGQKGKIWFDIQTAVPWKSEIYDKDGKITVQVYYDNLEINPKLDDKMFEIAKIGQGKK